MPVKLIVTSISNNFIRKGFLISLFLLSPVILSLTACTGSTSTAAGETRSDLQTSSTILRPNSAESNTENITSPGTAAAPQFTGVDVLTGNTISLDQYSGSVVLLNFMNYGCSQSLNQVVSAQLTAIRDLQNQRTDFVPISIFCGCCLPEVLREFAEQNDLRWIWILDSDNRILTQYQSYMRGYPTIVLLDKDQYIRDVLGYTDAPALNAKIDELAGF